MHRLEPGRGPDDPVRIDRTRPADLLVRLRPELERGVRALLVRFRLEGVDPEDVVQRVLVRALRALERFEGRGLDDLRAWTWTIARNAVRDEARRRSREDARDALRSRDGPAAGAPSDPADGALARERHARLTRALGRLDFEQRVAVVLRDVFGLPWSTVRLALGARTSSAARAVHERALHRLRRR